MFLIPFIYGWLASLCSDSEFWVLPKNLNVRMVGYPEKLLGLVL